MSTRRRVLIAGNWKMNKTGAEAREHVAALAALVGDPRPAVEVAVCPPCIALEGTADAAAGSGLLVMAQAVHEAVKGAHTGEVAAAMIVAAGADGVIVGHCERRAAGETDALVAVRVRAALDAGLRVILCVGEPLARRDAGETEPWLAEQVRAALETVAADEAGRLAIAYEPIWAIGTGRTASPQIAQEACAHVRAIAGERLDPGILQVLYGGSVTPENAESLLAQPDIDGALVGAASLDPEAFAAIVAAAPEG